MLLYHRQRADLSLSHNSLHYVYHHFPRQQALSGIGHVWVYVLHSMTMYMAMGSLYSHSVQARNYTNCIVHMYCTNGMGSLHNHTAQAWNCTMNSIVHCTEQMVWVHSTVIQYRHGTTHRRNYGIVLHNWYGFSIGVYRYGCLLGHGHTIMTKSLQQMELNSTYLHSTSLVWFLKEL